MRLHRACSNIAFFSLFLFLFAASSFCSPSPGECVGGKCETQGEGEPVTVQKPSGVAVGQESSKAGDGPSQRPVFMVPGIAGTGLMISATNAALPSCSTQPVTYAVPFRLWASLLLVRPPRSHQLCWLDLMQPVVDEEGEKYASKEGLNVEVDGYGTAHGFDFLDYYYNERFGVPGTAYFHRMLRTFYSMGYVEGGSLLGVPYDWRLPPWQFNFERLKGDIEARVASLGGRKADVLVHSLGSIVCNYFFNKVVDQQWKDKHINSYTLIAPATGGSFKAIKAILTGYNDPVDLSFWSFLDVSLIPVDILRDLSRNMGSIYALLPDIDLYGKDHVVLRQLLPKASASSSAPSSASHSVSSVASPPNQSENSGDTSVPRTLEFRRLSAKEETNELSAVAAAAAAAESVGAEEREAHEGLVAERAESQMRERLGHVYRYSVEERERLAAARETLEGAEEVVYTLGNWTNVLDADIKTRAAVAAQHMEGVLKDPGVPTRCVWSMFAFPSTDIGYVYTGTDLSRKPIAVLDVGDDTVPLRSLSVCTGWASTFEVKTFKNLDHMFIFSDAEFNNYIQLSFGGPPTDPRD
ncbi:hypothetical protein Emed_003177 [Eimeria media]